MANQDLHIRVMIETAIVIAADTENLSPLSADERLKRIARINPVLEIARKHWDEDRCQESAASIMALTAARTMHQIALDLGYVE